MWVRAEAVRMAENMEYQATIYDDVWRTLVHDFPMFLVALDRKSVV